MLKKIFLYNIADAKNAEYFNGSIDALMVNGNVFAYATEKTRMQIIKNGYGFMVDPMLYAIQADIYEQFNTPSREARVAAGTTEKIYKVKPSLLKLFRKIGYDTSRLEGKYNLTQKNGFKGKLFTDYLPPINSEVLINNVLKMQHVDQPENTSILMSEIQGINDNWTIAPSLIMRNENNFEWNKSLIKRFDVIPLLIEKSMGSAAYDTWIPQILEAIKNEKKILQLWVEKDMQSSFNKILNLIPKGVKLIVKFGSYENLLGIKALNINLISVITAFGYGESRNILPVGGGLPVNKVYDPNTHKRVPFANFYELIKVKDINWYHKNICNCKTCKHLFLVNNDIGAVFQYSESKPFERRGRMFNRASSNAQMMSTRHFVWNKIKEIESYKSKDLKPNTNLWR